jgi:hypothetical protein
MGEQGQLSRAELKALADDQAREIEELKRQLDI